MLDNTTNSAEALVRLSRDERAAAATLGREEARYLVDTYYQMQKDRIVSGNRMAAMAKSNEPHATVSWFNGNTAFLENQIKTALNVYAYNHVAGRWALGQKGIGPVLAAGFVSQLNIEGATTVGQWWRFAGLDPTVRWGKGEKRPWNGRLKVLCWKAGESFTKVSNREGAFYGAVYRERKAYEIAKNERGDYADQAARALSEKNFGADTDARKHYEAGRLPPARIQLRSQRYAVKLFLAHMHEVWYEAHHGAKPPLPYAIQHLGHAHKIEPPKARETEPQC